MDSNNSYQGSIGKGRGGSILFHILSANKNNNTVRNTVNYKDINGKWNKNLPLLSELENLIL